MNTHKKNNELTAFGLSCGYIESYHSTKNNNYCSIYKEHNIYYVKLVLVNNPIEIISSYGLKSIRHKYKQFKNFIKQLDKNENLNR